ncbi:YfhO family protein [bacterium]|nr:YfhO family protein [bacterium]
MNMPLPRAAAARARLVGAAAIFIVGAVLFGLGALRVTSLVPTDNLGVAYPWAGESIDDVNSLQSPDLTDVLDFYLSWQSYAIQEVRHGRFPHWNPLVLGGTPLHGINEQGLLYPPNALYLILPMDQTLAILAFAHAFIAGFGFFLLLRAFGRSVTASILGAVVFAYGGFMLETIFDPPMHHTIAWLPVTLLLGRRLVERPDARRAAALTLGFSAIMLAGNLKTGVIVFLTWGVFFLIDLLEKRAGIARARAIGWAGVAASLAAAIGAAQILPTMGFLSRTDYEEPAALLIRDHIPWVDVAGAIFPGFGAVKPLSMSTYPDFWSHQTLAYTGSTIVLLAAAGLAARRRPRHLAIALFGLVMLLVALGTPLAWPYLHTPLLKSVALSRGLLLIPLAAIVILGAAGFDEIGAPTPRQRKKAMGRVLIAAGLIAAVAIYIDAVRPMPGQGIEIDRPLAFGAVATAVALVLLMARARHPDSRVLPFVILIFVAANILRSGLPVVPDNPPGDIFPPTPITDAMRADTSVFRFARFDPDPPGRYSNIFPPDTGMGYNLADAAGYLSVIIDSYAAVWDRIEKGSYVNQIWNIRVRELRSRDSLRSPWVDMLNIKYILSRTPIDAPGYTFVRRDGVYLYRNDNALPRATFFSGARIEPDDQAAAGQLDAKSFDPRRSLVLVCPEPVQAPPETMTGSGAQFIVNITNHVSTSVDMRVDAPSPGFVLLTDVWDSRWEATVNGQSAPICRAQGAFRAIPVGPGDNEIRVAYVPRSFRRGLAVSAMGLGIVALLAFGGRRARRQD